MRPLTALLVVGLILPASRLPARASDFNGYRQIPCRYYLDPRSEPTGDLVDLESDIRESVMNYTRVKGPFNNFPSQCSMNAYVEAECRLLPRNATIGRAMDSLYAKKRSGIPLPATPVCGA